VTLFGNSCSTDLSAVFRKFYGQFNNILSVLGGNTNEMSTLHIVKTYCIPTLMYGCEAWSLSVANLHKLDVAWNNCFRRIFQCCWRETTRPLQFCSKSLPLSLLMDQRKLLFWLQTRRSDNVILRTMTALNRNEFVAVCAKYSHDIDVMTTRKIKDMIWDNFARTVLF